MMTAQSEIDGKRITRNTSHFKKIPTDARFQHIKIEDDEEPDKNPQPKPTTVPNQLQRKTYPKRNNRIPVTL